MKAKNNKSEKNLWITPVLEYTPRHGQCDRPTGVYNDKGEWRDQYVCLSGITHFFNYYPGYEPQNLQLEFRDKKFKGAVPIILLFNNYQFGTCIQIMNNPGGDMLYSAVEACIGQNFSLKVGRNELWVACHEITDL